MLADAKCCELVLSAAAQAKHGLCTGDLPPLEQLRAALQRADWAKFRAVDKRQLARLDRWRAT